MTPPDDPRAEYLSRIERLNTAIAAGERRALLVSNLRLAMFGVGGVIVWMILARATLSVWYLLAPGGVFAALVVVHARILVANERLLRARRYCERGLSRIDGTWAGTGRDGATYATGHPYARDLDLFGPGSLFQLVNTARTDTGEDTLADWLRRPAGAAEIAERQEAVAELRDRPDFRQTLAVLAAEAHVSRTAALSAWTEAQPIGLGRGDAALLAAIAAVTVVLAAGWVAGWLSGTPVVAWASFSGVVALAYRRRIWAVIRRVDAAEHDLGLLAELLARLEQERFDSPRLARLRSALDGGTVLPSAALARLRRAIAARDALRNEFVRPFALLLLVRSQAAVAIDRWHAAHRVALAGWITSVGEFEALASLATHAFEHPNDPFPSIVEGTRLEAVDAAHPLLPERVAVRNSVSLGGDGAGALVISGSNMSGKSTLLRTIGANAVLALAGGTVRAARFAVSPLSIGCTIRVEDSLQEGHSRFYAEILKIRDIVSLTEHHEPVLFLMDEILHGTNSHDRRIGAEAIVKALIDAGAIGLVTTHDLALTALAAADTRIANVHFEDRIEDGRMVFDYRMRPGVVERSNALELMRSVGIRV